MEKESSKNRRIAKNTIALYIRTLATMGIGLYTSRIILNALGIDDFGIYNVVGGVVAMFSIISASLSQSISRYLTFELGKENMEQLKSIFSTSINIQIIMSFIIIILAETIGTWFLNNKLNIASDRLYAANWVLQFSILSFIVTLISVPYNAAIIAHEKMKAFAYVGILEASLKLIIVLALYFSPIDKLITYAFMLFLVSCVIRFIYGKYCKKHFEECRYKFILDRKLFNSMSKFAGWNFISSTMYILNTQGVNIISNLFFGVGINAARGIAIQVDSITKIFINNFTTAVKPQIIKSYSSGEIDYNAKLICKSTKFSYFLMMFFALPFVFETETILHLWLKTYPVYAPNFVRLTMILTLIGLLSDLLYTNIMAIGKLKKYMITETCISAMIFIVSYILFYLGFSPIVPYVIFIIVYAILIIVRLLFLNKIQQFSISLYFKETLYPVIIVSLLSIIIPVIIKTLLSSSIINSLLIILSCIISICINIYIVGLKAEERNFVNEKIKNYKCYLIDLALSCKYQK